MQAVTEGLVLGGLVASNDGGDDLHLSRRDLKKEMLAVQLFGKKGGGRWVRTSKPGEAAQTLSPAALMMAALSTWPVPTRLDYCKRSISQKGVKMGVEIVPRVNVSC